MKGMGISEEKQRPKKKAADIVWKKWEREKTNGVEIKLQRHNQVQIQIRKN